MIEAVICANPLTQDSMRANLESHFQKLFGHANCRLFFHLTYAYIEDKGSLMTYLEEGYAPEAVVNYLCLLGWSPKGNREKVPLNEVVELFDLPQITDLILSNNFGRTI